MTGEGFVTRLGGDAFLVVLEGLAAEPLAAARRAAERLHEALRRPFPVAGVELPLRARVGIALLEPGTSPAELLRHAVVGVSRAKHGEEATAVFVAELDDAGQRLRLATGLRRALEGDELELHFQPLRVLADGTHAGFEALVRWRPPRGALVLPGEFSGFAETSGLIEPLGAWVLDAACRQLRAWLDAGLEPGVLGVNVSPRQLRRTDVPAIVTAIARAPPGRPRAAVRRGHGGSAARGCRRGGALPGAPARDRRARGDRRLRVGLLLAGPPA